MLKKLLPYIVCFTAALFLAYELLQLHMMNTIASMMMQDLHLSATSFGYISSTYLLADVIFLLPAGMILDRFKVRNVILSALLICVSATLLFANAQSVYGLAASHFLSGIGNAFCFLSCMILVTRWFEPKMHAKIMGWIITIGMLGAFIAQAPFSLLAQTLGWRNALLVDASIGVLLLVLIFAIVKENGQNAQRSMNPPLLPSLREAIKNPITFKVGLYTGMLNLPLMIISATFGTLFLHQIHHFSLTESATITGMISIGTIFGSMFFGHLSDLFFDRKKLMIVGGITSSVVMIMILFSPTNLFILAMLFFLLGFVTSSQVLGYPTIAEYSPEHLQGTSMGLAAVIIMGLPMLIQPLSGSLMDLFWNHQYGADGCIIYPYQSFFAAFCLLPILFLIGTSLVASIRSEKKLLSAT